MDWKEKFEFVISAQTDEGWEKALNQLYDFYKKEHKTRQEAYEKLENKYEELTGHRRYSSYDSYRVAFNRRLRNRRKAEKC